MQIDLDESEARIILSSVRVAAAARRAGRSLLGALAPQLVPQPSPLTDEKEAALVEKIGRAFRLL